jgi:hypothetical protein
VLIVRVLRLEAKILVVAPLIVALLMVVPPSFAKPVLILGSMLMQRVHVP